MRNRDEIQERLVKTICQKAGVACRNVRMRKGGQINAVFQVDAEYIVRIGLTAEARPRLERETALLRTLAGQIPVARVLAFGQEDGLYYQVQQLMPGQRLYALWKDLRVEEQETIAAQLASALKAIHGVPFSSFGEGRQDSPRYSTWQSYLNAKFQETLAEIHALQIRMVPGFVALAEEYFEAHQNVLAYGTPVLVHGDLNLGNLLVEKAGDAQPPTLSAILDFEFALQAPADYELLALEAFCLYPNDWTAEDDAFFCSADFASLIPLLRQYYPELFAAPHLRERLNVYHVYAALSQYLAWRKANLDTIPPERMAAKNFYLGRISNFLWDNGARMFFR